jgi:murein DD-endopeptidase MepM/ murein hydrolase activator NlpD
MAPVLSAPPSGATASTPPASPEPSPTPSPEASRRPGDKPASAPPTSAEPERLRGYNWPLYRGRMMTFFGAAYTGFLVVDGQRIHPGLDITTFCGDQVRAAHTGVVVAAGRRFGEAVGYSDPLDTFYAKIQRRHSMRLQPIVVVVDDGNGYRSMYVHLAKALVKVGDRVKHSTVIGLEGDTGNASGCHVHYELVRMDGPWMRVASQLVKEYGYPMWERQRVDPLRVLSLKGKRAGRFVPGLRPPRLPPSLRPPR